jgi:hypothetical protein
VCQLVYGELDDGGRLIVVCVVDCDGIDEDVFWSLHLADTAALRHCLQTRRWGRTRHAGGSFARGIGRPLVERLRPAGLALRGRPVLPELPEPPPAERVH